MGIWRRRREVPSGPVVTPSAPEHTYVAPGVREQVPTVPANDTWSPTLGVNHPTHSQVIADANIDLNRPRGNEAPQRFFDRFFGENLARHRAQETVIVADEGMPQAQGQHVVAPHPESIRPRSGRYTEGLAPSIYLFQRPFDQKVARRNTGDHFSMASNKRTYEIFGMAPVTKRRNTFRIDPPPHDIDIVDMPAVDMTPPNQVYTSPDVPRGRSWRLD